MHLQRMGKLWKHFSKTIDCLRVLHVYMCAHVCVLLNCVAHRALKMSLFEYIEMRKPGQNDESNKAKLFMGVHVVETLVLYGAMLTEMSTFNSY